MRRGALVAALVVAPAVALAMGMVDRAAAAQDQRDGIRVTSIAGFAPRELPRTGTAPIGMRLGASFRAVDGAHLPRLNEMRFAINREGRVLHRRVPRCRRSQLENSIIWTALSACRQALVGRGAARIHVRLPGQRAFALKSTALLFNASGPGGRPRILLYMSSHEPFSPFILDVEVSRQAGTYGTVLAIRIPSDTVDISVRWFVFALGRGATRNSRADAYLRAGCPAPRGLPGAVFPFVRSSFDFDGGTMLSTEVVRVCRAR